MHSRTLALPESANRQRATTQTPQALDATHGNEVFLVNERQSWRTRGLLKAEEAVTPDDLSPALGRLVRQQSQAIIVPVNGLFRNEVRQIVELATAARLPTIFDQPYGPKAGGLASYGVDPKNNYRRAADYVDKILNGAKPADMPIEFPTKIELVINLKTAKTLELEVPSFLEQRADEVIE